VKFGERDKGKANLRSMLESTKPNPLDFSYWPFLRNLAAVYIIFIVLVYLFQRRLQYFPDPSEVPLPQGEEYLGLETVDLTTVDGLHITGWHWPVSRPVTLLIFHGNAGHRGHRLDWVRDLHSLGYGVFILDYRGYGGSDGSPTEEGLYRDGQAALQWLQHKKDLKLVYFGESLGCGVAVELAVRHPPEALILQSGFSSALAVARKAYPYLPVRLLMKDRYECLEKIQKVSCPLLIIHGERDSLIPIGIGRELFEAAREPKEWFPLPGADHNDLPWIGGRAYLEKIDAFLRRHVLHKP
jgi:uncharacterized protein